MDIYYIKNEEQIGPFDQNALLEQLSSGAITGDMPVWWEGLEDWTPLESTTLGAALLAGLASENKPSQPPLSAYQPSEADLAYLPKVASPVSSPVQPNFANEPSTASQPDLAYQPTSVAASVRRPVKLFPAPNRAPVRISTDLKPLNVLARTSVVIPFLLIGFGFGVNMLLKATGLVLLGLLKVVLPIGSAVGAILGVVALFQVLEVQATTRGFYTSIWGIVLNIGYLLLMVLSIIGLLFLAGQLAHRGT